MDLALEIPERIVRALRLDLASGKRRALEMLAAEGYRSGALSRDDVGQMLDLPMKQTMSFLKDRCRTRVIALEEYENVADALNDFTEALVRRARSGKKHRR